MKKLIIARHVACHGSKISDEGENQLDWLYKRLYNHVFDSSLAILCSPAPRARATVCKHVLDMHVDEQELGKGEAAVIDLEERTVTYEAG